MAGFESPNYTQTPNDLFDSIMKRLSEAELKVVMAIVRQTFGYHKKHDAISLSQLEHMTGLSRSSCSIGVTNLIAMGLVKIVGSGKRGVSIYELVVNSYQSEIATSQEADWSKITTSTGSNLLPTKERVKKKSLNKLSAPDGAGVETAKDQVQVEHPRNILFDAVAQHIFGLALDQVNGSGGRIGKISAWLEGHEPKGRDKSIGAIKGKATPEHVQSFAKWWKHKYPNAAPPLDLGKFVDHWRKFATDTMSRQRQAIQSAPAIIQAPVITDADREAIRMLQEARRGLQNG